MSHSWQGVAVADDGSGCHGFSSLQWQRIGTAQGFVMMAPESMELSSDTATLCDELEFDPVLC